MNYSKKELLIFEAVLALSAKGQEFYSLTVQEIASEAGIGKGTIYEYFRTKEEIIAMTLIYICRKESFQTKEKIELVHDFKGKMYVLYDLIVGGINNQFSSYNLLMSLGGPGQLPKILQNYQAEFNDVMSDTRDNIASVLKQGFKEGIISQKFDNIYIEMVVSSNMMALGKSTVMSKDLALIKDYCYQMLIKSLN